MNDKQIKEFIDWLGYLYLDFDNNGKQYEKATRKEIKEKLKSLKK